MESEQSFFIKTAKSPEVVADTIDGLHGSGYGCRVDAATVHVFSMQQDVPPTAILADTRNALGLTNSSALILIDLEEVDQAGMIRVEFH